MSFTQPRHNVPMYFLPSGKAFCCGENENDRLGIDKGAEQSKFILTNFGPLKRVDSNYETCVIDPSGQLWINGVKHLEGKEIKCATSSAGSDMNLNYYAVDNDNKLWS